MAGIDLGDAWADNVWTGGVWANGVWAGQETYPPAGSSTHVGSWARGIRAIFRRRRRR